MKIYVINLFSLYFNVLLYKTKRFHVAVRLFSNRSQRTSKCGKNIVTHSAAPRVSLFCSYHILTSSVYRLMHSASELSGFTCTSSLTMNEKFQYRTRPLSAVLKNFEFIVSERVQVNPDNSRAMSALTFLLFKLNTLQAKLVKF